MKTLKLAHSSLLQGDFKQGDLNFLFTFQVNCPGCFFYGFPILNELCLKYEDQINFLGLSTAFEDFELNTEENTKALLEQNIIIGEVKKAFEDQGLDKYPQRVNFPVAMDLLQTSEEFITDENIESICNLNPNYSIWPEFEQKQLQKNIVDYLSKNPLIPVTFTLNQFRGTPTFVIFDGDYKVLDHWLGYKQPEEIKGILGKWL